MKRIIILSIFLVTGVLARSQSDTLKCSVDESPVMQGNQNYIMSARDQVILGAGFKFNNSSSYTFTVNTDHTVVPTTPDYLSSANIITGSSRTLNTTNCVPGTIGGSINISPTGAATYSLPIQVSPGSHGMQPSLGIVYSSQSGNDILGYSWHLSGLSAISRVNKSQYYDGTITPVTLTSADGLALDGQRLISTGSNIYSPENDPYTVIQYYASSDYYTVTTQDGTVISYGNNSLYSNNSKFYATGSSVAYSWAIDRITDPDGNYIQFNYLGSNTTGEYRINEIKYTGNSSNAPYNSINFYYEKRTDINTIYLAGNAINQTLLLTSIKVFAEGTLAQDYEFSYFNDGLYSKLNKIGFTSNGTSYNPTIVNWGTTPNYKVNNTNLANVVFGNPSIDRLYFGDFNGDGKTDVANLYENSTLSVSLATSGGQYTTYTVPVPMNSTTGTVNNYVYKTFYIQDVQVVDINNDGKDELMVHIIETDSAQSPSNSNPTPALKTAVTPNNSTSGSSSYYLLKYDEVYYYSLNGTSFNSTLYNGPTLTGSSSNLPITNADIYQWFYCDYDNNGQMDQLMLKNNVLYGPGTSTTIKQNVADVRIIDFNGDGQADLLSIGDSLIVWTYNGTSFKSIYSRASLGQPSQIFTGDFNGDGKTDILINGTGILYSTGTGFLMTSEPFSYNAQAKIFIKDVNNDGKDDIIIANNGVVSLYISTGTSFINTLNDNLSKSSGDIDYNIYSADLNADNQMEIIFGNNNNSATDYYNISFQSRLDAGLYANSFTDGNNVNSTVTYAPVFTNNSGVRNYPVIPIITPMYLVTNLIRMDMNTGSVFANINSTYQNAYVHMQGKGFLGFTSFTSSNSISKDSSSVTFNNTITDYSGKTCFYTWPNKQWSYSHGINTAFVTNFISAKGGNIANKLCLPVAVSSVVNDYIKGYTTTNTMAFDSIMGRVTDQKSVVSGKGSGGWSIETKPAYIQISGTNKSIVSNVIASRTNVSGTYTSTVNYTYGNTSFPLRVTKIISPGAQGNVTTDYGSDNTTFDSYGNNTKVTVSVTDGTPSRSTSCTYDSYGRFVKSAKDVTQYTSFAYYRATDGALLAKTDPNGLTTTYNYSSGGNALVTSVALPDGNISTNTVTWDNSVTGSLYKTVQTVTNGNIVTDYYNAIGQKLKETSFGFNSTPLKSTWSYLTDGRLNSATDNAGNTTSYKYSDTYAGRLYTVTGLNTNLQYAYSSSAPYTATVTDNNLGISKSQTFDGAGNITIAKTIPATGSATELDYTYLPIGEISAITNTTDGSSTTMGYDNIGNQISLKDPDAGTVKYKYNGFSQLVSQHDVINQVDTLIYDQYGRLRTKKSTDKNNIADSTSYVYSFTLGSLGLLQSVSRDKVTETYTYDALCRPKSIAVSTIGLWPDGMQLPSTTYIYNNVGQLGSIAYPSGLTVNYQYDGVGNLKEIDNAAGGAIWTGNNVNALNQWTKFTLGNGLVTQWGYDATFQLNSIQTGTSGSVQNLVYNFNAAGQLNGRSDGGLTETFHYDQFNRLKDSQVGTTGTLFKYTALLI